MQQARATVTDRDRLAAVRRTGLLDAGPQPSFDRIADLARRVIGAPIALVSLVDADRQYFACCLGLDGPYAESRETPLSHSICRHTLDLTEPLLIEDGRRDARVATNGAITELGAVAYLGIPLRDRDGHALGSFCVIDDEPRRWTDDDVAVMTELAASVMTEIELRELLVERDRLGALIESTPDLVLLTDADGVVVSANPAAEATLATSGERLVGRSLESLVGASNRKLVHRGLDDARTAGVWTGHVDLELPAGRSSTVSMSLMAHGDDDGRGMFVSVVARDVSSEVAASRLVADSEQRLRSILDSLFIFVGLLEVDGTLTDANRAALDAAGLRAEDVLGQPFWDTYWWSWDPDVQAQLRRAVERTAQGTPCRYDAEIRVRHDARITIDFQLAPLLDDDGQVVGIVPSGLDITERKKYEQQVVDLAELEAAQRRQAVTLFRLAQELAGALTLDQIVAQTVSVGGEVVGADLTNLALLADDGQLVLRHGPELDDAIAERWTRIPVGGDTPLGSAVAHERMVCLASPADIRAQFPAGADDAEAAGIRALAAVPIPGGAIGFSWEGVVEFTTGLRNSLALVGELVGQALGRARAYERERRVADSLQRSFLPQRLPALDGYDIAWRYEPAADGLHVGGDWFDLGMLDEERYVLSVGDVVGHGLEAAAAMGQLRNAFAALTVNALDVERLVDRLDQFAADLPDAQSSTMVAAECRHDGSVTVVSAGHPPPMIRRAGGTVDQIDATGPPLAFGPDVRRPAVGAQLESGDVLICYTDGLIERRDDPTIDAGLQRLREALSDIGDGATAQHVIDELFDAVDPVGVDDIAMVVLRRS